MKAIVLTTLAAALATASMSVSAGHKCHSGMKYPGYGAYGPSDYYMHHHPMHHPKHHQMRKMQKMMWYKKHKGDLPPGHPMRDKYDAKSGKSVEDKEAGKNPASAAGPAPTENIIDTAVNAGNFTTLVEAIKSAELVDTLNQAGPFTVFAPTDEAFARVPETIRAALVADKNALAELLTYHVLPGEVTAADAATLNSAKTVQGSKVQIDSSDGVVVDGARVVAADIRASNGIIHVIDTVMIPN